MIQFLTGLIKDKKKISIILFSFAVVLLLINVILAKIYPLQSDVKKALSEVEINKMFNEAIKKFGFNDEWITKKTGRDKSPNISFTNYIISVPSDLPIPVLLSQVFEDFSGTETTILSKEIKTNGLSTLEIFSNGKKILNADFDYESSIRRKSGLIGFIIFDEEKLDEDNFKILNSSAEKFSFLFLPDYELNEILDDCHKEFSLILNDDIADVDYKLETGYSADRLQLSVKAIINSFGNAAFFMIDDESSLFNSSKGEMIIDWLEKSKLRFLHKRSIIHLLSEFNLSGEFNDVLKSMSDGEAKLILIGSSDYLSIADDIVGWKKIGYKFINPSEVIRMNQSSAVPL
jgi:hypothetical protein